MTFSIEKKPVNIGGSCSACKRGELTEKSPFLQYPYKKVKVIEFKGSGIIIHLCFDCAKKLKKEL